MQKGIRIVRDYFCGSNAHAYWRSLQRIGRYEVEQTTMSLRSTYQYVSLKRITVFSMRYKTVGVDHGCQKA
jgi:hypothetical protein